MKVICPSYGRTGTKSMQVALEILGCGPCYHMTGMMQHHVATHPQLWQSGHDGRGLPVAQILNDYNSVADWPAADFYKEILEQYPDAKVVLTLRDPDSWWESIISTIHNDAPHCKSWGLFFLQVLSPSYRRSCRLVLSIITLNLGKDDAKADFIRHNAEVRDHVPADKLLEFSVKEGWEPLCTFLGVPVPEVPFPRVNSGEEMRASMDSSNWKGWIAMFRVLVLGGVGVGVASFVGGKRVGGGVAAVELSALSYGVVRALRLTRVTKRKTI